MDQMIELLQFVARTAYKTQETVKTITLYIEDSKNPDIHHLCTLLEAVKTNSIKLILEIITQASDMELDESLHIINSSIESGEQIYAAINGVITYSAPENLKCMLDANMQGLKIYFDQLNSLAMQCLGKSEVLSES